MLRLGVRGLSDAELIAVLIRSGSRGVNALEMAQLLLATTGGKLGVLQEMSAEALARGSGMGPAKAMSIIAALELGRRCCSENSNRPKAVNNAMVAANILSDLYTTEEKEECWCIFLKRSRIPIGTMRVSEGGASLTEVDIKKIVARALELKASSVILSHNHPSGNPQPSLSDIKSTNLLRQALDTFEIALVDHIIASPCGYYSFSQEECFDV